jgi:hypothetical protein
MASWSDHLNPYSPDPRMASCVRWNAKGKHVYREANLWPDGLMRCVYCRRQKGRRYSKPRAA